MNCQKVLFRCPLFQEQIKTLEAHIHSTEKNLAAIQAKFDMELSANAAIKQELAETKRHHDLKIASATEQFARDAEFLRTSYEQNISELKNV